MASSNNDNSDQKNGDVLPVVGIGASAGGLKALQTFFEALPDNTGLAFVVVQHLSPDKKSDLSSILERSASIPVEIVKESTPIHPDHVYVIPPDRSLRLEGNRLHTGASEPRKGGLSTIDHFFQSLAEDRGQYAIGLILSGTRDDGSRGMEAIKARGGLTLVQHPDEAEYDSMPQSAIDTGRVDLVLPVAELANRLVAYIGNEHQSVIKGQSSSDLQPIYSQILNKLRSVTEHDFSHYKRSTILRRIERRMKLTKSSSLGEYRQLLEDDIEEVHALFDELLITVTEFFRDPKAFEALEQEVIPDLFDQERDTETPIRVWVPGCASGEEVYSIAILLWEEASRREVFPDFKLFATDLDARAIEKARRGLYSEAACEKLTRARRDRFFEARTDGYKIVSELRDRILFAVHDILRDPPFARQDLVSCRNLLIYLDKTAQKKAFEIFHYSLRPNGHLFLGVSESISNSSELFRAIDKKNRLFVPRSINRRILPLSEVVGGDIHQSPLSTASQDETASDETTTLERKHLRLLHRQYAPPSLLVDRNYEILHVAGNAQNYLRVPHGEPTNSVLEVVPPELQVEIRGGLIDAFERRKTTTSHQIGFDHHGTVKTVRLKITPLSADDTTNCAQIVFEPADEIEAVDDVDDTADTSDTKAEHSLKKVVAQLEDEKNRLKDKLSSTIERYETTTEELKTSNEELLAINEELQSTTEELETSREEIQSTNEELSTVNEELSHKISELDDVNSDLKNLLSATNIGTIFLTRSLHIKRFTDPISDYFNILPSDLGRPLEHITHQLDYDQMHDDVQRVIDDLQPIEREVQTASGKWFIARVHPYRTVDDRIGGAVLTFFNITERRKAQKRVTERENLFQTVFDSASDSLFLFSLDDTGEPEPFSAVNDSACHRLDYSPNILKQMTFYDLVDRSSVDLDAYFDKLRQDHEAITEVRFLTRSGETIVDEVSSRLLTIGGPQTVISVGRDIEARKNYEQALVSAKEESERLAELRASFLANMSHEIRTPLTSIIGISQLLGKKELPERQHQMVQLIQTSGQRLKQTLDSVLDISRLEAGEMKPKYECCDVVSQIRDDVDMLRPVAERKDIELRFETPRDEYHFWSDVGFLDRIVYNLTENAIKFTEEGSVEVSLDFEDEDMKLVVADTGIGIEEDFLPHLFDKFKQASSGTSRNYEGSGLGMSLIHKLVELMGGSIRVDSTRGEGTTIELLIPEHPQENEGDDSSSGVH